MKSTLELIDKKEQLKKEAQSLLDNGKKEMRKLTDSEQSDFERITKEIDNIDSEIRNLKSNLNNKKVTKMEKKEFRLLKAINDVVNNRTLDEASQNVINAGVKEMRKAGQSYSGQIVLPMEFRGDNIVAGAATDGKEAITTDTLNILEPLRNSLVLTNAGATYLSGLVGDVAIPVYSGSNVGWEGEVDAAVNGKGTFSEIKLTPHRLTAFVDVSKQFIIQDSVGAENMLKNDIVRALSEKLESTILGAGKDANQPTGLLNGVIADTADVTYKDIVTMETTLEAANETGNFYFVVSPSAKAILKTTKRTNETFLMQDNEIDGIPVLSTNSVASKGVLVGNFADYVIGQWGGIDLTVDPYTQAANGKVRLVINAYFDGAKRRNGAIVGKILK